MLCCHVIVRVLYRMPNSGIQHSLWPTYPHGIFFYLFVFCNFCTVLWPSYFFGFLFSDPARYKWQVCMHSSFSFLKLQWRENFTVLGLTFDQSCLMEIKTDKTSPWKTWQLFWDIWREKKRYVHCEKMQYALLDKCPASRAKMYLWCY